jgi:AraC family carnitine catabolism transcriptional activator
MLSLFCTLEPLRVANRFGGELFRWHFISTDGKDVVSSIGIPVSVEQSIDDVDHYPIVFVCASYEPEIAVDKRLLSWLKRVDRRGAVLGGLETGSYALARACLLDGHKVAMHWESQPGFEESFPQLLTTAARYQIDARRMTCAGGISAMDMMLQFIGARHGNALATQVCETFMHDGVNQSHQLQRMQTAERFDIRHEQVWKIIELMEQNIEEPLSASQLADLNGLPLRQLERLFKKHCHDTPTRFYLRLRLERARQLLKHTRMSVVEVAVACGFHSPEYFSRRYRAVFDCSPREDRKIQAELERMSLGTCRTQR